MLRFPVILIIAVIALSQVNAAQATLDADSTYWFPKTSEPPIIDGEMDPVWYSVTNLVLEKLVTGYAIDDWFDVWARVKLLWDDSHLYLFIDVHDDVIQPDATNTYEQDGVELYFDADNSKCETFDTIDDIQLRFNTDWVPDGIHPEAGFGGMGEWPAAPFDRTGIDWVFRFTDFGYVLEGCIPLANLLMEGVSDWDFGFEVQINDNDGDARSAEYKWWSTSGNSWQLPSIWGSAGMDNISTDGSLPVEGAYDEPVIDGILDDAWEHCPVFSAHNYVTQTANVPDDWNIYERVDDWKDMYFDFRVMSNEEFFFLFTTVYDDIISIEAGEEWEKDGIELYFDGDNSKNDYLNEGIPYDANDRQLRRVFSDIPADDYACQRTETGWTMEWRVPYTDLGWNPERGLEIGFDVQLNDQDDPALKRSGIMRWWGTDHYAWLDASMLGTAVINIQGCCCCNECWPIAITMEATDITSTSARVYGMAYIDSYPTNLRFQYGTTTSYGSEIIITDSPIKNKYEMIFSGDLHDLIPDTTYHYRFVASSSCHTGSGEDMTFTTLSSTDISTTIPLPQQFSLQQNFPNPANPVTNIVYELPVGSHVKITVYNLQGELVRTLYNGEQGAGRYPLLWDGADESGAQVASGLYFLRMDADGFTDMKKIMLIK